MGKNAYFVSHKKSKQKNQDGSPKLPVASDLVEGEIAINFGKDVETLSIKNESGDVVTFSSDNYYTEKKLGSGFTGENSANTVTSVIESNEKVTALALADLDERKLENSDLSNYYKKNEIDNLVGSGFSYSSITEVITENEEIVSSALNDLDERKLDASAYTPTMEIWVSGSGVNSAVLKGGSNTASGTCSVAEGNSSNAIGNFSHAEGHGTASGDTSHAEGVGTALGSYSHAEGYGVALGRVSHAEGQNAIASGSSSHAEGYNTNANGQYSHAEGQSTKANGDSSHAEGAGSNASGSYSHAEGHGTANGDTSHAEGNMTTASGVNSHAEGNQTTANGENSHAEGYSTIASGWASHTEGAGTQANGYYSHAEGAGTKANNMFEHASGQYNVSNSATTTFGDSGNTLFSVGNGSYSTPHNAFEIRQNGDIYITSGGTTTSPAIRLQDYIGESITVDQVIDSGTSASTNAVATKAVVDKLIEDEQVWAISLNQLNDNKFGYANFDSTNRTIDFYKNEDDYTSGGTAIDSVDLSDISIDIDQTIDSGTSASTDAVSTSAVYDFVTSYTPSITVDQDFSNTASTNPISTKAVYSAVTENELVWANAFVALSGTVSAHTANTEIHVTAADKTALANKIGYAAYDSNNKKINFYKNDTDTATSICYIDATDFIKDGMVSNVEIKDVTSGGSQVTCLVISFNTDAGKQDINIPLTDIFDASNYYTKSQTSGATELSTAFDAIDDLVGSGFTSSSITEVIIENEKIVSAALNNLDDKKLDASAYTPSVELWVSGSGVNSAVLKGGSNTASGTCSVAEGASSNAIGNYSHAEGHATADGDASHAEGTSTKANGNNSHAEGYLTTASGQSSHAEGFATKANGNNSHAEGQGTVASGSSSHAEGSGTKANGNTSHAEGSNSNANGEYSHAEGSNTQANGQNSHAEGNYTKANGNDSHAEGFNTTASGNYSHAEGDGTVANNESEHASGQFNVSNSASTEFGDSGNTLFSVGNGTGINTRHNAFEIRQNGDIYITSGGTATSPAIKLQDSIGSKADKSDLGGLKLVKVTQTEYDALTVKDPNTLYVIVN